MKTYIIYTDRRNKYRTEIYISTTGIRNSNKLFNKLAQPTSSASKIIREAIIALSLHNSE